MSQVFSGSFSVDDSPESCQDAPLAFGYEIGTKSVTYTQVITVVRNWELARTNPDEIKENVLMITDVYVARFHGMGQMSLNIKW